MASPSEEVNDFLADLAPDVRAALQQLREDIRAAAPEASEKIAYGVPAFSYRGRPLVSFGVGKTHCSFYVQSPEVMQVFADELAGYDTAKGTIRFPADHPLDGRLVTKLVEARMNQTDEATKR